MVFNDSIKHFALILSYLIGYIAQLCVTTEIQILLEEDLFFLSFPILCLRGHSKKTIKHISKT